MQKMTLKTLKDFYINHLFNNLIYFWINYGIDRYNGGFFTCFNNYGDKLVSRDKYVWSQGRFLWMLSHVYHFFYDYLDEKKRSTIREASENGAEFLKDHAILPGLKSAWVLDEKGNLLIADKVNKEYDLGIEADHFLIYGLAEFARAFKKKEYYELAVKLFNSVYERLKSGNYKTAPQGKPSGYKMHGKSMIMLETTQELADIAKSFKDFEYSKKLIKIAEESVYETANNFIKRNEEILLEAVKEDGTEAYNELIGSYFNPGHSLEDAWFMMHYAERTDNHVIMQTALDIVKWMTVKGWDEKYGGLPEFLHKDGGPPRGLVKTKNRDDHLVKELKINWDKKLWWVHSESLYALLRSYEQTGDSWFIETYWKYHEYTFKTFPNPDSKIREWIQIRDRKGKPIDAVVALPVKDPYHITRAFMHIIKSLDRITG
ncbi:MAG: hypothetical protein DRP57_08030 [Spirochaetes bacterium]|nr:MAG: hypothetical protein DRP57_08030 [Spirochaetota bacterium]